MDIALHEPLNLRACKGGEVQGSRALLLHGCDGFKDQALASWGRDSTQVSASRAAAWPVATKTRGSRRGPQEAQACSGAHAYASSSCARLCTAPLLPWPGTPISCAGYRSIGPGKHSRIYVLVRVPTQHLHPRLGEQHLERDLYVDSARDVVCGCELAYACMHALPGGREHDRVARTPQAQSSRRADLAGAALKRMQAMGLRVGL